MHAGSRSPLHFGLSFEDLYRREGLLRLDAAFLADLQSRAPGLHEGLEAARRDPESLEPKSASELMIELAPYLEDFVGRLLGIEAELQALQARHDALAPLRAVKRKFVQRKLVGRTPEQAREVDVGTVTAELEAFTLGPLTEMSYATHVSQWLESEADHEAELKLAAEYATWAVLTHEGRARHREGVVFKLPQKIDVNRLVPHDERSEAGLVQFVAEGGHVRHRDGFHLTDAGTDLAGALDQAGYCIKCHNQGKDSCSTGLREKNGEFKRSVFGVPLAGCPVGEKISEMNQVKGQGNPIGALAIVTVDNPMAAATGHRICNDCMKSCIYQKQEPVDIPQVETRTLKDVLELPWGFEIYSLLTRWNPLNFGRPYPREATGRKVLIVGLGPAGFTLAHHLMNDGHAVVAVDGLKIEPLPEAVSGVDPYGRRVPFEPIVDVTTIYELLDRRVMAGFGGVAEYGITVRWNKNFLKIIRLLLERRAEFAMFGGVRFGGTLTVDDAFDMGFDHIALCMGAGRPTVIPMKNGLARGVRQASDFLMALQLTGAAKSESLANLQIRMPIVVIGGGLTAIDTATESLAYYVVQVEKFLHRYEDLTRAHGEDHVRSRWIGDEAEVAAEFLEHGRAIRAERRAASAEGRAPRLIDLLNAWGGVTVAYRRRLVDAPSYTLNHEEITKAFEEGIRFAELLVPEEVELDATGTARALRLRKLRLDEATGRPTAEGDDVVLPARTILVAAGTQPNTVLAREDAHNVQVDGRYFRALDEDGQPAKPEPISKPGTVRVLMSIRPDGRAMSFFGDLHPSFAGNVVKAMGSAKQGYPVVSRMLARVEPTAPTPEALVDRLNDELRTVVHEVVRLTPNIVEIVVRAPIAARAFRPGQFYRLQNFETLAARTGGTILAMEALALTGASVDHDRGLLSTIVLEMGGSSDLCALLKPGEPICLMGPTGAPTETPGRETVLLVGGGLGNAVLFSIGQALRAAGSRVIYFAGYKKLIDRYKVEEIEKAADIVTWCSDEAPGFTPARVQDRSFVGNIVEAMAAYARGDLGDVEIPLDQADRLVVIGSDAMMRGVQQARHGVLRPFLKPGHHAIGSINSPMQCMMKEICAQCLQTHQDPATGVETVVFSCFNQDQPLDHVRFDALRSRLSQNSVQEKLTKLWIDECLHTLGHRSRLSAARPAPPAPAATLTTQR
ncbi:FAD-dependent oxidoreductase [Paludisphaera mucosa]|uniref:FAD-dependent oxidoreductase n=1 Tax=Paludisphaera mucosa TaxID=3030827 RepID=A0ABT6FF09_9BACT|nr:FAD-dependent oxidoreductase [Paludisphaera mucosa]MDG3006159.1 FAD-dependent oxidoreductase [Paludisphaera mucosa]